MATSHLRDEPPLPPPVKPCRNGCAESLRPLCRILSGQMFQRPKPIIWSRLKPAQNERNNRLPHAHTFKSDNKPCVVSNAIRPLIADRNTTNGSSLGQACIFRIVAQNPGCVWAG